MIRSFDRAAAVDTLLAALAGLEADAAGRVDKDPTGAYDQALVHAYSAAQNLTRVIFDVRPDETDAYYKSADLATRRAVTGAILAAEVNAPDTTEVHLPGLKGATR